MLKKITLEEFEKLIKTIPEDLKDAIFSIQTHEYLESIEKRYEITQEEKQIAFERTVTQILLGLIPYKDFQETLIEEGFDPKIAKALYDEVWRLIFFPVKISLEKLAPKKEEKIEEKKVKYEKPWEEKPTPPEVDIYREPIE